MYFKQAVWDPLARRELTVAEHEASWGHDSEQAAVSVTAVQSPMSPTNQAQLNDELLAMLK